MFKNMFKSVRKYCGKHINSLFHVGKGLKMSLNEKTEKKIILEHNYGHLKLSYEKNLKNC